VSSLWEQRAARNEALFREVNENIAGLEERHGSVEGPVFICECANPDCTEQLAVEPEIYQRVREQPRWFVLLPGHEDPQIERVVERHSGFLVVEKIGAAGQVAEQTDS
jgi:hypothetical protein